MTGFKEQTYKISSIIKNYISKGITPDGDTINFIKSAYGVFEPDEIFSFMESGDNDGILIDMISYPPDSLRESVEEYIPAAGLSESEIRLIEEDLVFSYSGRAYIFFNNKQIVLPEKDFLFFIKRILQRLNFNISFEYISVPEIFKEKQNIFSIRPVLRKKKFISSNENSIFINDLICNYFTVKNNADFPEFINLINHAADMLNFSDKKPFDILSEKKYYYENAIMEAEEFSRLLKIYSMEFIMMRRIQPPLISSDEAQFMISIIDRLTSIVYRMIIPSVRNVLIDDL